MLPRVAFFAWGALALVVGCSDDETPLATACTEAPDLALLNESSFETDYTVCAEAPRRESNPGEAATTCLEFRPGLSRLFPGSPE